VKSTFEQFYELLLLLINGIVYFIAVLENENYFLALDFELLPLYSIPSWVVPFGL
jgi:hypothetical protein